MAKNTIDTLNTMLDMFLGKEDDRQGITRGQPNSVNNFYFGASVPNILHEENQLRMQIVDPKKKIKKCLKADGVLGYILIVFVVFGLFLEQMNI